MFLAGIGAHVKTTIIRLYGPNAAGKKMLYYWMKEFFGEDNVEIMSSQTAAYLKRKVMQGFDTRRKTFIFIEERADVESQVKYTFEQIYSEDKIKIGFNVRGESGDWEPIEVELQGPLTFITTATEIEESLHAKTREWEVNPDESRAQTERVKLWFQWRELLPPSVLEQERKDIEVVRAYVSLLKDYKDYRVPFITKIKFPMKGLEDRRKLPDFTNLMRYATHLFQYACPRHEEKRIAFATPFIFDFVKIISSDVVAVSRGSLNAGERKLLNWIQDRKVELLTVTREGRKPKTIRSLKEGDLTEQPEAFTVTDILEHADYPQEELGNRNTITQKLKALANKGWLTKFSIGGQGKAAVYGFRTIPHKLPNKLAVKSEEAETSSIRLTEPISDEFLNLTTSHILEGVSPTSVPAVRLRSLQPQDILFQPDWHGIDELETSIGLKRALREIKEEGVG